METNEPIEGNDESRDFSRGEETEKNYNRYEDEQERRPRYNPNRWDNGDDNEQRQYSNNRRPYHRNDGRNNYDRPRYNNNRYNNDRNSYNNDRNSYNNDRNSYGNDRRSYGNERRSYGNEEETPRFAGQRTRVNRAPRSYESNDSQRPRYNRYGNDSDNSYSQRPRYNSDSEQPQRIYSSDNDNSQEQRPRIQRGQRPRINRSSFNTNSNSGRYPSNRANGDQRKPKFNNRNGNQKYNNPNKQKKNRFNKSQINKKNLPDSMFAEDVAVETQEVAALQVAANLDRLRLNRFIAMAGVCSRREADELIKAGKITVNGETITEMGVTVNKTDDIRYEGRQLVAEHKVYVLLNKPKDTVTTTDDPEERRTVMDLVSDACEERIVPVGRLDRNTTGVLLLTNDGDLTEKLTHPKYEVRKIYHVFLDRPVNEEDLKQILKGVELEDGEIKADDIRYVDPDRKQIGIQIHSGRNRIVRRIFEHFGYEVEKLDRVYFAGLSKVGLPRGRWRYLTDTEINKLKAGFFK